MATSVYQINVVFHGRKLKEMACIIAFFFVGNGYHGKIVIAHPNANSCAPTQPHYIYDSAFNYFKFNGTSYSLLDRFMSHLDP